MVPLLDGDRTRAEILDRLDEPVHEQADSLLEVGVGDVLVITPGQHAATPAYPWSSDAAESTVYVLLRGESDA